MNTVFEIVVTETNEIASEHGQHFTVNNSSTEPWKDLALFWAEHPSIFPDIFYSSFKGIPKKLTGIWEFCVCRSALPLMVSAICRNRNSREVSQPTKGSEFPGILHSFFTVLSPHRRHADGGIDLIFARDVHFAAQIDRIRTD